MSETGKATGRCLCGAVRLMVAAFSGTFGACHCDMCRRWGGGPLMATNCGSDVSFEGEEHISVFDSSGWADRGFCSRCGSHLFYRLKQQQQYIVPIGLFDSAPDVIFDTQVFIDEKPAYYAFVNDTRDLTGAEVEALFAGNS